MTEKVVAVLVGGSVERMVSYYACLYAGYAFCPLEAGWPNTVCEKALVSRAATYKSTKSLLVRLLRLVSGSNVCNDVSE